MKKKQRNEYHNTIQRKHYSNEVVLLIPALFILTLFMFCVRGRVMPSYVGDFFWYTAGDYVGDLFAYFRMQVFTVAVIGAVLCLLAYIYKGYIDISKHIVYIPMALYVIMVVLSYLSSEYKEIALLGSVGRSEGTIVLIGYICILFYAMNAVRSERGVKLVVRCFCIACLVLGVWGILQVLGAKLTDIPSWLYVPWNLIDSMESVQMLAVDVVTWFFSNQNYTSFFMVFPICMFAMICISKKDTKDQVIYAALTGLMMFNLWRSESMGGMIGLAVAFVVAVFMAGVKNIVKWRKNLGLLILAGVISMAVSLPAIFGQVGSSLSGLPGQESPVSKENYIDYIITDGSDLIFSFSGKPFTIAIENNRIRSVTDSRGAPVDHDNRLFSVSANTDAETGYGVIEVATENRHWYFLAMEEGKIYFPTPAGKTIELHKVEKIGFEDNENFGSGRGYIWSRTLPMLEDTIFLGKGADTYMVYFPHDDYAGKYNVGMFTDSANVIVDKPHNMYFGTAFNTGLVSLVALVAIYLIYLVESIRTYWKHTYEGFKDYIGLGIFIAIAGFLVSGLMNDSTVQMMPMVYVLLGTGFAINRMIAKEKMNEKK